MLTRAALLMTTALSWAVLSGAQSDGSQVDGTQDTPAEDDVPVIDEDPPPAPGITLPEGPASKILAQVTSSQLPAGLPKSAAAWFEPDCWSRTETWTTWAALVTAEAKEPGLDPSRRAQLALLARAQGRGQDAWQHLIALDGKPAWIAAVAPRLFPGIPLDVPLGPGGRPKSIPSGTILRPLLPPRSPEAPAWRIEWRDATYGLLPIDGSEVDFAMMLEGTGVQAEFSHRSGPVVELGILLPEPEAHQIRVEYINWSRQDQLHVPLLVTISAEDEEPQALYGRIRALPAQFPTPLAGHVPTHLSLGGLWLDLPLDDPDREWLAPLTEILSDLVGAPVRLGRPDPGAADALPVTGTVVRLTEGPGRAAVLRYLVSTIETLRLPPPLPTEPEADTEGDSVPKNGAEPDKQD
jgi:hypothetical protein